jgi:hypothetical protein
MVSRRLGLIILVVGLLLVSTMKTMFAPFLFLSLGVLGLTVGLLVVVFGLILVVLRRF